MAPEAELLDRGFAGFMALPGRSGRTSRYDPRTVRQRYDLVGNSRIHVPLLVDLERRGFLWTDAHLPDAAARCPEVAVLRRTPRSGDDDELWTYRRGADEDTAAFAARAEHREGGPVMREGGIADTGVGAGRYPL